MAPHTAGTTKVPDNGHEHHHRLDDNRQDGPGHDEPREIMTNEHDKDPHNISGTFKDWQYLDVEHDQSPPQGPDHQLKHGPKHHHVQHHDARSGHPSPQHGPGHGSRHGQQHGPDHDFHHHGPKHHHVKDVPARSSQQNHQARPGKDHHDGHVRKPEEMGECCPEGSRYMYMSASDEIERTKPVQAIARSDFQNSTNAENFFFQLRESGKLNEQLITFEADNGWLDVNGSNPRATNQFLTSLLSPYASRSPYFSGANARTTGLVSSFSGRHNPNANANGTVRFIELGSQFKVDFSMSQIGNFGGPDEPGIARQNNGGNIDRGINVTLGIDQVTNNAYDQFLEVVPSESEEGQLEVRFSGTDISTGNSWQNPVYGFGFYLMGREDKRDVYIDIYDVNDNLITSELTYGSGMQASKAAVEYVAFHICEGEEEVGRFVLREEFNEITDNSSHRDIFSIDNLTLFHHAKGISVKPEFIGHKILGKREIATQDSTFTDRNEQEAVKHIAMEGRGRLTGTNAIDIFHFQGNTAFGKREADMIVNFNKQEGDVIELSSDLFNGREQLEIIKAKSRQQVRELSHTDVDVVIWDHERKPISLLFLNNNGDKRGFGEGRGLTAVLKNHDEFCPESIKVV